MSKEKQIEEMAKLICSYPQCVNYNVVGGCKVGECRIADNAESLYNAGYRKQSEGEWKDRHENKYANHYYECSVCGKPALNRTVDNGLGNPRQEQALSPYCPHCGAKMKGGKE